MSLNLRQYLSSILIMTLIATQVVADSAKKPKLKLDKGLGLPLLTVSYDHTDRTVDDTITEMAISVDSKEKAEKLSPGRDLYDWEVDLYMKAIADKSVPNSEKILIIHRYGASEKAAKVILAAKKAGFKQAYLLTDGNRSLVGKFTPEDNGYNTRFSEATWQRNGQAKALQLLEKNKIPLNPEDALKKDYFTISIPLMNSNDEDRDPLMHEKIGVVYTSGGKILLFVDGSANFTEGERSNNMIVSHEDILAWHFIHHSHNMVDAYVSGLPTWKMKTTTPVLIRYKDGYIKQWFTDGRYELNEAIENRLQEGADQKEWDDSLNGGKGGFKITAKKKITIKAFYGDNFVDTHRGILRAYKDALYSNPDMTGFLITDNKFSSSHDWNVTSAYAGILNVSPIEDGVYNRFIEGLKADLVRRTETYVVVRPSSTQPQIDRDGAPVDVYVNHNKISMIQFVDASGKEWLHVFTGSYNKSRNFHNAELRREYLVPIESKIAKLFLAKVKGPIAAAPQYYIKGAKAFLLHEITRLLEHSVFEMSIDSLDKFIDAVRSGNHNVAKEILMDIAKSGTTLAEKDSLHRIHKALDEGKPADAIAVVEELEKSAKQFKGQVAGQTAKIRAIKDAIKNGPAQKAKDMIYDFMQNGYTIFNQPNSAAALSRIDRLINFIEWYGKLPSGDQPWGRKPYDTLNVIQLTMLSMLLTYEKDPVENFRKIIEQTFWIGKRDRSPAWEQFLKEAWTAIGLKGEVPGPETLDPPRKDKAEKPSKSDLTESTESKSKAKSGKPAGAGKGEACEKMKDIDKK